MRISDWSSDVCSSDLHMIADQRFLCRGQAAHRDLGFDIMARLDVIAKEGTTLVAAHFLLQRIEVAEDALRGGQAVLPAVERLQIGDELPLPVGCEVEVMRKQPAEGVGLI